MKKRKYDIILISAVLLAAALFGVYNFTTRKEGAEAVVTIDGQEVMRLPLDVDTEVVLGEGEHTNTLVIKDGRARVTQASCPDHVCIRQGDISYEGQAIVCLPNKTVITIEGGEFSGLDATARSMGPVDK